MVTYAAKELHFNRSGEALKRMQAGVDKLASVVGVTLGPKVGASSLSMTANALLFCYPHTAGRCQAKFPSQQGMAVQLRCLGSNKSSGHYMTHANVGLTMQLLQVA